MLSVALEDKERLGTFCSCEHETGSKVSEGPNFFSGPI